MEIKAEVIADSVSDLTGKRIVTFELTYPRFIHSELLTHRLFSRNAASSRAIPVNKVIEQVRNDPATPVHWGKNQPGMQADEELDSCNKEFVMAYWKTAAWCAAHFAEEMNKLEVHKQVVNRILEPFQWMKTVLTATEFDNFFWLRKDKGAQPELQKLAECMWDAIQDSKPFTIEKDEWHLPYVRRWRSNTDKIIYTTKTGQYEEGAICDLDDNSYWKPLTLDDAIKVSASCCAQVSYRALDDSLEKADGIYKRLVESKPVHASPFEHAATPMPFEFFCHDCQNPPCWPNGATHVDRNEKFWSGNFEGFVQYRQLLDNHTCWNYKE